MGDRHIELVTKLFHDAQNASLATITAVDGTVTTEVVMAGAEPSRAPEQGMVKLTPISLVLGNEAFGYRTITVERPLADETGKPVLAAKGKAKGRPISDSAQRDTENVPLTEDVQEYFEQEVLPHAPDAWIDQSRTKIGYEIPFSRYFYVFEPPRDLVEIDIDLKNTTARILSMLKEVTE